MNVPLTAFLVFPFITYKKTGLSGLINKVTSPITMKKPLAAKSNGQLSSVPNYFLNIKFILIFNYIIILFFNYILINTYQGVVLDLVFEQ